MAGLVGLAGGCYTEIHYGDEACHEDYDACMDEADGPDAIEACEAEKESCLASCGDWRGEHDDANDGAGSEDDDDAGDAGDAGDSDGASDSGDASDSDGAGDPGAGDSDDAGDSADAPDPACFEIHATCVAQATTIAEVDACEVLLDHCLAAEPCDDTCEPVCPDPGVSACLDVYEACADAADDAGAVQACAAGFDACVAGLDDSACVPQDPAVVEGCLEQHALCTSCVDDADDLWLCKQVFDACVAG